MSVRLLTPRVFEALKTALTVEVLVGDGGLARGAPPTRGSGGLEVLRLLEARPLVVNFQVGEGEVRVGCGDGVMSDFEIEAFGEYGRVVSGMREEVP
ncbi:MAG: hypothetical protein QXH81_08700, partial [Thermofilaceae archaeon]